MIELYCCDSTVQYSAVASVGHDVLRGNTAAVRLPERSVLSSSFAVIPHMARNH